MPQEEMETLDGSRNTEVNFPGIELFETLSRHHVQLALSYYRHNELKSDFHVARTRPYWCAGYGGHSTGGYRLLPLVILTGFGLFRSKLIDARMSR